MPGSTHRFGTRKANFANSGSHRQRNWCKLWVLMLTTWDWQRQLNTGCLLQHVAVEERQVPTVVSEPLTESPLPLRLLDDFSLFTTEAVDGAEQPRRLDELQDGASN